MTFSLNDALDTSALSEQFRAEGYVSIPGVLATGSAERVARALQEWSAWNVVFSDRGRHIDIDEARFRAMPADTARQLQAAIYAQAAGDFQYYYQNYPIYDAHREGHNREHVLHAFYEWLDGDAFLHFARRVTGHGDIAFVDAQATRYGPGHFLTVHDDSHEDKHRRAAYVFNFTERWSPDWGGYLQLLDDDGHVRRGLQPGYNTLNLLAVPQPHNVGFVAPFASAPRLSITGWLRYGAKPAAPG